jgi:hypothetical protein
MCLIEALTRSILDKNAISMAQTAEQIQSDLDGVREAIRLAYIQGYSINNRSMSRNLLHLMQREKDLERKLTRLTGSGPLVITNANTGDFV